jgi:hypothetical protein
MHPINASQPSHISPLLKIYRGTLAIADRRLFSIFRLFEQHRHLSVLAVFRRWTASAVGSSSKALDALTSLDPTIVMKTWISFPSHAVLSDPLGCDAAASSIYDPNFVLALLASTLLDDGSTMSGMEWVALFRSNSVCVAIRALSSKLPQLREIASQVLLGLWAALQVRFCYCLTFFGPQYVPHPILFTGASLSGARPSSVCSQLSQRRLTAINIPGGSAPGIFDTASCTCPSLHFLSVQLHVSYNITLPSSEARIRQGGCSDVIQSPLQQLG